ncbi:DUF742 domain-containing protein [Streptomyces sp. NPDC060223]|uniref:DUF742 domain-containing protein n=1 Tax=unclassified Streptomyces TaxID=2593676 RepID=UPI003642C25D
MATPPGGSSSGNWSYGPGQGQGGQGDGSQNPNRYNFPSAPTPRPQQPYAPQGPGPSPYDQPSAPRIQPVQPQRRNPEPSPAGNTHNPLVRPYAMTGGRTRPRYQLAIEALVHTTAQPHQMQGQLPEHQRICNLCREIKSVAEISALLTIPLGVARILVADLAEAGLVAIHQPGGDENAGGQPDVTLLERVLSGLRKL